LKGLVFIPRNKEIEKIMQRLMRYPVVKVDNDRIRKDFGRYRCIRRLKKLEGIIIKDRYICLPEHVYFEKRGKKYFIRFK